MRSCFRSTPTLKKNKKKNCGRSAGSQPLFTSSRNEKGCRKLLCSWRCHSSTLQCARVLPNPTLRSCPVSHPTPLSGSLLRNGLEYYKTVHCRLLTASLGTKGRTSVATSSANDLYNNRCSLLKGVQRFGVVRSFIGAVLSFLSPR